MKINNGLSFFFSQYQDDLWSLLDIRLPALLSKSNVRLVVLDSVAAIFRSEFDLHELADRAKTLAKLGNKLQRISHQYDLCVVCVNQVRLCSFKDYDHDYDDGEVEKSTGKQKKQTYTAKSSILFVYHGVLVFVLTEPYMLKLLNTLCYQKQNSPRQENR